MIDINGIIGFILGAGATLLTAFMNNRYQLKRDKLKFDNEFIIQEKKKHFDLNQINRKELLIDLNRLNLIVGKLENSIDLTSSINDSEKKLTHLDFDVKYQKEIDFIIELNSLSVLKFPEINDSACILSGLHNQYWECLRLLLLSNKDKEDFSSSIKNIIEIKGKTAIEVSKIRNLSLKLAEK